MRTAIRVGAVAACVGAAAWCSDASAAAFASARFGGEQGSVVTTNPTALYYNPAGIGFSTGTHVLLDGQLALRYASWDHPMAPTDPAEPPGTQGANVGSARLFNVFGGPALGATTNLGNFAFGAGLFVPFGGSESWSPNDHFSNPQYPLASAGVQRWHVIDGSLSYIYLTAGAAYRIGPLSLGASGNFAMGSVSTAEAKSPAGLGVPDTTREGRGTLNVSGSTGSFGVGAMLEVVPEYLWLGASYQSQPGLGAQVMNGTLGLTSSYGNTSFKVNLTQALPDIYRLGVRWRPRQDTEFRLFGDFTRWSVLKTQCVALENYACQVYSNGADATGGVQANLRLDLNDTYGVRGGASFWASPEIELFAGLGFETAAVPDATLQPGLMDADNVALAAGGRFHIAHWFYLAASYTQIEFFDRDNIGKSSLAEAMVPTQQQDGGGIYSQWVGIIDVNLEKEF
jgi:long-chain fatty acid transport protein